MLSKANDDTSIETFPCSTVGMMVRVPFAMLSQHLYTMQIGSVCSKFHVHSLKQKQDNSWRKTRVLYGDPDV
jgi:hypothetical protein